MHDYRWVEVVDNLSGLFWRLFPNNIDVVSIVSIILASVQDFVNIIFGAVLAAGVILTFLSNPEEKDA